MDALLRWRKVKGVLTANEADRSLRQYHSHEQGENSSRIIILKPGLQIQSPVSSLNPNKAATDFVEEEYGLPHEKKFLILFMKWKRGLISWQARALNTEYYSLIFEIYPLLRSLTQRSSSGDNSDKQCELYLLN